MTQVSAVNILDAISYEPNLNALRKRLRVKEGSAHAHDLERLAEDARNLARPRALYLVSSIDGRSEEWVQIGGMRFESRVLSANLEKSYRVFPYLATCGQELQIWADSIDDMVLNYWAEAIKEQALAAALRAAHEHLMAHYQPGQTASMSPGSLVDWPIQQQRALFDLFGEHHTAIGVQLTDSLLMVPTKSVSGIRFPNEDSFESCQLCPREGCPGRRAVYDPELYDSKFCLHSGA